MKGSLKVLAIRQIFGELPNEEKRKYLEYLLDSFACSDLIVLCEKIQEREKQIASIAETHLKRFDSDYMVSAATMTVFLPKHGLIYYRNLGLCSNGIASKEEQDEFCRICKDFFENPEYIYGINKRNKKK